MNEKIYKLLSDEFPNIDFKNEKALVDDGVLDSIMITSIIAIITMEFGITIPYVEITDDNFNSIEEISAMVERLSK